MHNKAMVIMEVTVVNTIKETEEIKTTNKVRAVITTMAVTVRMVITEIRIMDKAIITVMGNQTAVMDKDMGRTAADMGKVVDTELIITEILADMAAVIMAVIIIKGMLLLHIMVA
jgi:hypothetical protein